MKGYPTIEAKKVSGLLPQSVFVSIHTRLSGGGSHIPSCHGLRPGRHILRVFSGIANQFSSFRSAILFPSNKKAGDAHELKTHFCVSSDLLPPCFLCAGRAACADVQRGRLPGWRHVAVQGHGGFRDGDPPAARL